MSHNWPEGTDVGIYNCDECDLAHLACLTGKGRVAVSAVLRNPVVLLTQEGVCYPDKVDEVVVRLRQLDITLNIDNRYTPSQLSLIGADFDKEISNLIELGYGFPGTGVMPGPDEDI